MNEKDMWEKSGKTAFERLKKTSEFSKCRTLWMIIMINKN